MDLNTILIILGVIALIALVVHGLWSNRREKSKYFKARTHLTALLKVGRSILFRKPLILMRIFV